MFDILVYLYESYLHAETCPDSEQLIDKLAEAGFEEEEISAALDWLSGLRDLAAKLQPDSGCGQRSVRIYCKEEQSRLSTECRGYLAMLENAGLLDAAQRELIIERAMAVKHFNITLSRFKVVVLMVLWQQDHPLDSLLVDELLNEDEDDGFSPILH